MSAGRSWGKIESRRRSCSPGIQTPRGYYSAMTKKAVGLRQPAHTFIRLSLSSNSSVSQVTPSLLLEILDAALTGVYGVIGGAINHNLVSFDEENASIIIRCHQRDEERIWAATTFMTSYKGALFQLEVLESSPSLVEPSSLPQDLLDSP